MRSITLNGHSTWHVDVCRLLCEQRVLNSPRLLEKYARAIDADGSSGPLHLAALSGRAIVVTLLAGEFSAIFNVNQMNNEGMTPLHFAIIGGNLENLRFLLDHGADPNLFDRFAARSPLFCAILRRETAMVGLLLEKGANPTSNFRYTEHAIRSGNIEILPLLLARDAKIRRGSDRSALSVLLQSHHDQPNATRETKLEICRILVKHEEKDSPNATINYLQDSFGTLFYDADDGNHNALEGCEILLLAGYSPFERFFHDATSVSVWQLFVQYGNGIDPFRHYKYNHIVDDDEDDAWELFVEFDIDPFPHYFDEDDGVDDVWQLLVQFGNYPFQHYFDDHDDADGIEDDDADDGDEDWRASISPFHHASHQKDTALLHYFLELWNEEFASSGGRDTNGDAPIDLLCRDPRVSIQAVTLLVESFDANLSTAVKGYFPFQSAIKSIANLDVIYFVLRHWPDALAEKLPDDFAAALVCDDSNSGSTDGTHDDAAPSQIQNAESKESGVGIISQEEYESLQAQNEYLVERNASLVEHNASLVEHNASLVEHNASLEERDAYRQVEIDSLCRRLAMLETGAAAAVNGIIDDE